MPHGTVVDFRARPNTAEYMRVYDGKNAERSWERFGFPKPPPVQLEEFVRELDANEIDVAVFTGRQGVQGALPNEYIAECVSAFPQRIVGFAGVDPRRGQEAIDEVDHAVGELKLSGLALDPPDGADDVHGRGYDDEGVMYPIYERALHHRVPVVLTLGPLMTPFSDPAAIERVAADFPGLTLVCSHAGWPNTDQWIGLAYRYENVIIEPSIYIYLPGASPLIEAIESVITGQVVYASAFPFNGLDSVTRFRNLGLSESVFERVVSENPRRVLGLSEV